MVNLPPDSDESRRRDRILDFDELLAIVLAFLGIGAVLWWGLSRDRSPLAALRLDRPLVEESRDRSLTRPSPADGSASGLFQPRRLSDLNNNDQPPRDTDQPAARPVDPLSSQQSAPPEGDRPIPPTGLPVPTENAAAPSPESPTAAGRPSANPPLEQSVDISDVPPDYWAYPFIKALSDGGFLPALPSGQFQPDQALTRAELAALMNEAFGDQPTVREPLAFGDVAPDYWATAAINQMVAQGFMNGYPDNTFQPDRQIPRHEVMVAIVTGLNLPPSATPDQTLQAFVDAGGLPDWSRGQVAAAAENGLIVNYPALDQLQPNQPATRAEIAALLHQALVLQGKLPAVQSEHTVPSL